MPLNSVRELSFNLLVSADTAPSAVQHMIMLGLFCVENNTPSAHFTGFVLPFRLDARV